MSGETVVSQNSINMFCLPKFLKTPADSIDEQANQ